MSECRMGNPGRLTTDIGPVIDAEAKENIERHIQADARQRPHRLPGGA
ncbi:PutA and PutP / proline dehydrogenase transcriptional repressor [Klebsiella pneumoniae]|uniref:PutA and PutP / proline dehydrogenase transcriptional repressor n=1 Tax=Klebsiella pneumoniae TaxID=573 RepID=A0A377TPX6_KLEPN|nr:PutA and PutP / proline dehydrogenase transcriptional repressor [Klebsiella pneumoniae]